jgi:hypothetical protein
MKTAPHVVAEYAQLNRDYDINKKNYNDLVTRRESAVLSGDLENTTGVADFRLIDPPRASPKPVAPNRLLLLPLALAAAIAAGMAVSFAASQLRAVFYDPRSLTDAVGLPLLGTVSLIVSDADLAAKRADLKKFAGAGGALVLIFAIGMMGFSLLSGRAG